MWHLQQYLSSSDGYLQPACRINGAILREYARVAIEIAKGRQ